MTKKVNQNKKSIRASYRSILSGDSNRPFIFMTDVISQPKGDQTLKFDKYVHYQCARSLPMAEADDLVILTAPLDRDYLSWLRSINFGTDNVISFNVKDEPIALAELVLKNLDLLKGYIANHPDALLIPYYCSQKDLDCAQALRAEILGCDEFITREYFNKVSFKDVCIKLEIPMVAGSNLTIDPLVPMNQKEMQDIIKELLNSHSKVLIRGAEDSGTRSFFTVENPEIKHLYQQLVENHDQSILIEPLLHVISSPNAQWCINNLNEISFIGISAQLFQGFKWAGNLSGQYYSKRVYNYIKKTSEKIVKDMSHRGYRGVIGIDYIVCNDGIYPIENNARLTGSTFAIAVTDKAKERNKEIACWKFFKAQTNPCSFKELKQLISPFLYDGQRTNSVFPMMTDLLSENGTFIAHLMAEDMYHIDYMVESLNLLGIVRA